MEVEDEDEGGCGNCGGGELRRNGEGIGGWW